MTAAHPWTSYAVKWPPPKKGFDNACLNFDMVDHVSHVSDAIRILQDGKIRAGLVYDESRLNTERITVCWVSPKSWADGYIYGNVAFRFRWDTLIEDKKVFWVEDRKTAKQKICRFLISEKTYDGVDFDDYSPKKVQGPLYHDVPNHKWYHNNLITNEFMLDEDISLSSVERIEFVKHHPAWCSKTKRDGGTCPDIKWTAARAGAIFLSWVIGTSRTKLRSLFATGSVSKKVESSAQNSLSYLCRWLTKRPSIGTRPVAEATWDDLLRASLMSFWQSLDDQAAAILAAFPNKEAVEAAFWRVTEQYFEGIVVDRD